MRKLKSFTLIEMLTVLAIIGILAATVVVGLSGARARARDLQRVSDLKMVADGLERYYAQYHHYPWSNAHEHIVSPNCTDAQYNSLYSARSGYGSYLGMAAELKNLGFINKFPVDPSLAPITATCPPTTSVPTGIYGYRYGAVCPLVLRTQVETNAEFVGAVSGQYTIQIANVCVNNPQDQKCPCP